MSTYAGPIVDVDVHNTVASPAVLKEYLPSRWQDYASVTPPVPNTTIGLGFFTPAPPVRRRDGGPPASTYQHIKEDVLEAGNVFKAILTHGIGQYPELSNHDFMLDCCRAANDWMVDKWLTLDERLATVLVVPTQMPEEAAAEIHRLGDHPQMVGIVFASNPLRRPLGDPIYHPIYKAAVEHGLAITTHVGVEHASVVPAGVPSTNITATANFGGAAGHHISSFITHGVFEKFPEAKFVLKEYGITLLPSLMWRLDAEYQRMKEESPWVKRYPSEYMHDHVRLSTQPIATGPRRRDLIDYLSVIDGIEDMLLFSTDYPHSSMDDYEYVARQLPAAWHRKVFCENACASYGWTPPPAELERSLEGSAA
jgi:predicted TIM-barrel fold metal-dependent hydrolase